MISSIRYRSKSAILSASTTYIPNKRFVFEILILKVIILAVLFILPPIVEEGTLCILVTVLMAFDFWGSKNLGRKFLNACWYIDTEGEDDQWIYEASLKSPTEMFEALFWYSFIFFGIMLVVMGVITIVDSKISLACAILIGIVENYINFYAFSNIIDMRNEGVLQMISDQVQGQGIGETIKLPLAYRSKLQDIPEQNSLEYYQ